MCLIVLARQCHPRYPLVVVANRDEYHAREADQAHWWPDEGLLAGRDRRAGGTWMGVDKRGRWAAVTNFREGGGEPAPRSRGEIPVAYLGGLDGPREYLEGVRCRAGEYAGFCTLAGDLSGLYFFSNRGAGTEAVPDGIHTLSNHLLDTPWPKAELARLNLGRALRSDRLELEALLAVLAGDQPFADHELPVTGIGMEMERVLSPPFIAGDAYGTRCTTVLTVDSQGRCCFAEQSFGPGGHRGKLALFEFDTQPPPG